MGKLKLTSEVEEYEIFKNLIVGKKEDSQTGKIETLNLEDFFNMVKKACHHGLEDISIWRQENYPNSCQFDGSYPLEDLESDLFDILDYID